MPSRAAVVGVSIITTALLGAGCGADDSTADGCDEPVEEVLDPQSPIHIIDPDDGPDDPAPTSGPHIGVGEPWGVLDDPLSSAVQLRALEIGRVMVQYRDDSDAADLADWAPEEAVVAPNPEIDAPIVATAWQQRMNCEIVDRDALTDFVEEFAKPAR